MTQFALALVSFGVEAILQGSECRFLDRRVLPEVPRMLPDYVWSPIPNGKQTSTKRHDVRFASTCQSRSACCRLTQQEESCYLTGSLAVSAFTRATASATTILAASPNAIRKGQPTTTQMRFSATLLTRVGDGSDRSALADSPKLASSTNRLLAGVSHLQNRG